MGFARRPAAALSGRIRVLLKRKINKKEQGKRKGNNEKMEEKMQKRRWRCKHLRWVKRLVEEGKLMTEYKKHEERKAKGGDKDQEKEDKR